MEKNCFFFLGKVKKPLCKLGETFCFDPLEVHRIRTGKEFAHLKTFFIDLERASSNEHCSHFVEPKNFADAILKSWSYNNFITNSRKLFKNQSLAWNDDLHFQVKNAVNHTLPLSKDLNPKWITLDDKAKISSIYRNHLSELNKLQKEAENMKTNLYICGKSLKEFEYSIHAILNNYIESSSSLLAFFVRINAFIAYAILQVVPIVFYASTLVLELLRHLFGKKFGILPENIKNFVFVYVLIFAVSISIESADEMFFQFCNFLVNEVYSVYNKLLYLYIFKEVIKEVKSLPFLDKLSYVVGNATRWFFLG
jgi:hypothetical protein